MGAYKDKNGVTRVGAIVKSIGGFFTGIFKKTSTTTNTPTVPSSVPTTVPQSSGSTWSDLLITIGGAVAGWIGTKNTNTDVSTDPTIYQQQQQAVQEQQAGIGKSVVIGISLIIAGIAGYFVFRKK